MIVVAHLSDIHLDGGERSADRARKVLAYLNNAPGPIDAVLVTGDIADHGEPGEYRLAREILKSRYPVFDCPGNHDKRAAYREGMLGQPPADGPINQLHEVAGAVFAMCDSSVPGRPQGFLDDETIEWLDGVLAGSETPAFVCFHHPPVDLGIPAVDVIRQHSEGRLAAVIERHPRVVALLCGHTHTAAATTFAGRPLVMAPGVVSTSLLPFEPLGQRSWDEGGALDLDGPPSLAFHVLHDDRRLTTHYRVVS
jgi:3',5'-cyclic AMP phosphodiesterase CpdA